MGETTNGNDFPSGNSRKVESLPLFQISDGFQEREKITLGLKNRLSVITAIITW